MAGIGFQLKKLFKRKGVIANLEAYLYSTLVTIGPTIICVVIITSINFILKRLGVSIKEIEILQATIMYSFIFSLILMSGYNMVLSRYLADKLYEKKYEDILPSLMGSISIMVVVGGVIGLLFYLPSKIDIVYKFFAYILFIQLIIQTIISTYVSALKNYKKISFSFIIGFIVAILLGFILYKITSMSLILICLIGFNIGFFLLNILLIYEVQNYFSIRSNKYYEFLKYFKRYIELFLTNTFWILGLYISNLVLWLVPSMQYIVVNTYVYAPKYDIPSFYSFLTIMPTLIIFVVKLETAFFTKYQNYFYFINNGASYDDIENAREAMKSTLYRELVYIMQIQLFFTLGFIIIGIKFLPMIGFTSKMIGLFNILTLGYYCAIMMFVIMTILLYYEDKNGAVLSSLIFFGVNLLFTILALFLGDSFYGISVLVAGVISLIFSLYRLRYFINNIEYYVFCKHSSWAK